MCRHCHIAGASVVTPPRLEIVPEGVPAVLTAADKRARAATIKGQMNRFERESKSMSPQLRAEMLTTYRHALRDLERARIVGGAPSARTKTVAEAQALLDRELSR